MDNSRLREDTEVRFDCCGTRTHSAVVCRVYHQDAKSGPGTYTYRLEAADQVEVAAC